MKRLCFALLLTVVLTAGLTAIPPITTLAATEVTFLSIEAEASFPQSITFRLEAEAETDIVDIDLQYAVSSTTLVPTTCKADVDFVQDEIVSASWTWNMLETGGLPPGTTVEYTWLVKDDNGHVSHSPAGSVWYHDLRYDWDVITEGNVNIYWYDGDTEFAQGLMDTAHDALGRLAEDVGVTLEQPATFYIYANSIDLQGALVYPQEWTGGVAFTDFGIIAIGISPGQTEWSERAISHELGHLVVHQAVSGPFGELPTWLDEGLAQDAEGELRSDLSAWLDAGIAADSLFSARSLCSSFPSDSGEAKLCYGQSYSLVQFLLDSYGRDKVLDLLNAFKAGSTYDDALLQVYGFDLDGLNSQWRESVGLPAEAPPKTGNQGSSMPPLYIALIAVVSALGVVFVVLLIRLLRRSL